MSLHFRARRHKCFDVGDRAREVFGHPFDSGRGYEHVVFDADADVFVLFEGCFDLGDKVTVLRRVGQVVEVPTETISATVTANEIRVPAISPRAWPELLDSGI